MKLISEWFSKPFQGMLIVIIFLLSFQLSAQVSGTVYQDLPVNGPVLNTYGIKDANELGVEGVIVTTYPGGANTTTAADGTYSIAATGAVRVEFTWPSQTWLQSSPDAAMQNTSVQFVTAPITNIDFGLHNPIDYADSEADVAMTFQCNNSGVDNTLFTVRVLRNTDIPGVTNAGVPTDGDYDNNGVQNMQPINGDKVAFIQETGSVWGTAYNRKTEDLYVSSFVRRHTAMGPSGTGAIYKIDNANNVTLFATVANTGVLTPNAMRDLSDDPNQPGHDPIFNEVGRIGLGDLDISADGTQLYTININTSELVIIDISNPATQTAYAITNPFATCPDADVKSWGIGQNKGKLYVGSTCTSDVSEGVYVSEFDGTNFTSLHQVELGGQGENSVDGSPVKPAGDIRWLPWYINAVDLFDPAMPIYTSNVSRFSLPTPILADIEFDEENGMILGMVDRTSIQSGHDNLAPAPTNSRLYKCDASGDIMRVCNLNGTYYTEGHANCPQQPARTVPNTYYTDYPEYFGGDEWNPHHGENSLGGLAYQQGSERILLSSFDPVPQGYNGEAQNHSSSGIQWLNTVDGERTSGVRMAGGGQLKFPYAGKAGGMGDIEYLNSPAPIEIGNLVWDDANSNGIQDAGEPGLAGVVVELQTSAGVQITTATTDANGNYIFSNAPNGATTGSHIYNLAISSNTAYKIVVPTVNGGNNLTLLNVGEGANTGLNDSNANTTTGEATVLAGDIPIIGANNHTFDFGYAAAVVCPPNEHTICTDDSNPATLTAQAGVTNVIWYEYNEATMMKGIQVGVGSTLIVLGSNVGPEGSRKCYVYEGLDANGCPGELCCPVCIITEDCCPDDNCYGVNIILPVRP